MCGIFGYSGPSPDLDKVRVLGIQNDTRGGNGCGIYIDGTLHKSVTPPKFGDWVKTIRLPQPTKVGTTFGHCRKATVGAVSLDNTHPFEIRGSNNRVKLVGMHNGTISNWSELCEKHNIDSHQDIQVDSVGLLSLLAQLPKGDFSILEEYVGAAALAWVYASKPNELYLFHGKSGRYKNSSFVTEERPLYYWDISKQKNGEEIEDTGKVGLYFSSIKESLVLIGALESEVEELPHNKVFIVENGILREVRTIDRSKASQEEFTTTTSYNYGDTYAYGGAGARTYPNSSRSAGTTYSFANKVIPNPMKFLQKIKESSYALLKNEEIPPISDTYGKVYFCNGLYWRSGYPIHSRFAVYDTSINGKPTMMDIPFYIDIDGTMISIKEGTAKKLTPYYFYRGYLMKDKTSYEALYREIENYTTVDATMYKTCYAKKAHPRQFIAWSDTYYGNNANVSKILIPDESRVKGSDWWGCVADGPIYPLFTNKVYHFEDGELITIEERDTYNGLIITPDDYKGKEETYDIDEFETKAADLCKEIMEQIEDFIGDYFHVFETEESNDTVMRMMVLKKIAEGIIKYQEQE